ncbi:hypothetical protein WJ96_04495 [Burkholderia ubonensis]|uniref:Uncharacterized protein n=2 Tax=Burkholderia ubonensis TaxID=101571 RepID=A0AAW3MW64_9BURK|nr:hypothetical protein WJ96_04495 [Burkholderia ubonensis]KVZ92532.1 hypothetical protein WL25_16150 [Burkholderia ubonensis]
MNGPFGYTELGPQLQDTFMSNITADDLKQIKTCLNEEYPEAEVDEMLESATFEKTSEGVIVTYDNGVKDRFFYRQVLLHSSAL